REKVEVDLLAVDGLGKEASVVAAELLHLVRRDEAHALRLAHLAAELAALLVEHVAEKPGSAHDPRDACLVAEAHAFGQLVADEAAAHDQDVLAGVGLLDDRVGVVERLEAETSGDLVGTRSRSRLRSSS